MNEELKRKNLDENVDKATKNKSIFSAMKNAINGLIHVFKTEKNLRIDYIIGVLVFGTSFFFNFTKTEFACLCLTIGFVIFAEMINSTIEYMVDLLTDKYDERAKAAKDIAAGAVLIASGIAVVVAYFLFIDKIKGASLMIISQMLNSNTHLLATILFIIILLTVILKGFFSKTRNYVKAFPSARIVISFGLATFLLLITNSILVGGVAFALCFIITELKRENEKVHLAYIILSALLGILLVLIVYQITLFKPFFMGLM